jgi:hypothetical protein
VDRPAPSRIFALNPGGTGELILELEPVYSNGIVFEANGDIVWVESYTNAVKRRTRAGRIVELCLLPDKGKPDGLKIAKNGYLYISALLAKGLEPSAFGFTRILRSSRRRRILQAGIERGWLRLRWRERRKFGLRPFAAKS